MSRQTDYWSATIAVDKTVYPTVGENIRSRQFTSEGYVPDVERFTDNINAANDDTILTVDTLSGVKGIFGITASEMGTKIIESGIYKYNDYTCSKVDISYNEANTEIIIDSTDVNLDNILRYNI